jgi:ubiquinone/menaquinone biosynthesis C-methylase UbiE
MPLIDFVTETHKQTTRNYLERVTEHDKAECTEVARQFGFDYWDGDRKYGYGGYRYDGRWRPVAERLAERYGLSAGSRVLDVGCGKGFLLYDLTQVVPGIEVAGLDISAYAIEHAREEVKPALRVGTAASLPFPDASYDLVLSINTLHNLYNYELQAALREIVRVCRRDAYIVVDSYRNAREKVNLMYWQITCECFYTPAEWEWWFAQTGYTKDYSYVFFE